MIREDISVQRFSCQAVLAERQVPTLMEDARRGLWANPRQLPPKYFYDDVGSRLFDRICDTPEYYPTRTESALLQQHARQIMGEVRPDHIIELGSGTSRKTRWLLDACGEQGQRVTYWPFDVCEPMLREAGEDLLNEYPWLSVHALVGDYGGGLAHLPQPEGRCLYLFLGGTIGNFAPQDAEQLLSEVAGCMSTQDYWLMGADRVKNHRTLWAAYNDAEGITAAFNRNLLSVLNRELGADFDAQAFAHDAVYNPQAEQIEMYLVAQTPQEVHFDGVDEPLSFESGERIQTEISRKFTERSLNEAIERGGMQVDRHFEAENAAYSLVLAHKGV